MADLSVSFDPNKISAASDAASDAISKAIGAQSKASDASSAAASHKTLHQDAGTDEISVTGLSGLLADDQHVLDAEVLAIAAALVHGDRHLPSAADPIGLPKFSAHKNGTNQTGILNATLTKITFTTEEYDDGSKYDAPNSKWIPGIIGWGNVITAFHFTGTVDLTNLGLYIYKNGVAYKRVTRRASGTEDQGVLITCDVLIDSITDYFEVYVYQGSGISLDINGIAELTWFTGHMLP